MSQEIDTALEIVGTLSKQLQQMKQTHLSVVPQSTFLGQTPDMQSSAYSPETTSYQYNSPETSYEEPIQKPIEEPPMQMQMTNPADLPFKRRENPKKYTSPGSRVALSYSRILMLLGQNSNFIRPSGHTNAYVIEQLQQATTPEEVQRIINSEGLSFSSNRIGGKTKKVRKNKRQNKSMKRH